MNPLDLSKLTAVMEQSSGNPEVIIGLIDGPVLTEHPELAGKTLREISGNYSASCTQANNTACLHGTFVAGVLSATRGSFAPAICPNCTLLIRPIFFDSTSSKLRQMPSATPQELATAIIDCIDAGARVINMSLALAQPSIKQEQALAETLNYATKRGVIVVAAAGNQGTLGSSVITRHPLVIPVVAVDANGRPVNGTNLGSSIGRQGLSAPGDKITSLGIEGQPFTSGGTSVAVPFVTGAIALLWSIFPTANAAQIKHALLLASTPRRATVVPPLMNAMAAYRFLQTNNFKR
jgi:subtilisin family serine protease